MLSVRTPRHVRKWETGLHQVSVPHSANAAVSKDTLTRTANRTINNRMPGYGFRCTYYGGCSVGLPGNSSGVHSLMYFVIYFLTKKTIPFARARQRTRALTLRPRQSVDVDPDVRVRIHLRAPTHLRHNTHILKIHNIHTNIVIRARLR